jgi:hypothetical protein
MSMTHYSDVTTDRPGQEMNSTGNTGFVAMASQCSLVDDPTGGITFNPL